MRGHWVHYEPEELAWIEARKEWPRADLHRAFVNFWGRPDVELSAFKGMCKRKGFMTGRTGRIEKGAVSHNKGKKMPFNPNSAATQFQKGQRPHTWRGAGHERIDVKDGYVIMIVDEPNPWTGAATRPVHKHHWLWEKANGPVPEGMRLKCLDGDKTNVDPSNWKAIPKAMGPRLNGRFGRGYDQAPAELKPTIMAIAELEHQARVQKRRKADA